MGLVVGGCRGLVGGCSWSRGERQRTGKSRGSCSRGPESSEGFSTQRQRGKPTAQRGRGPAAVQRPGAAIGGSVETLKCVDNGSELSGKASSASLQAE